MSCDHESLIIYKKEMQFWAVWCLFVSGMGCVFENTQVCRSLEDIENEASILSLIQNLLTPQSTLVEVVYGIMVAQDDLRKRKQMSQNMLIDEEFQFELFEHQLLNQRRNNYLSEQLLRLKLDKFFIPRSNCFEQIIHHLDNLIPLACDLTGENRHLFTATRDQLQYRSACYSLLGGITNGDIDALSKEEAQQYHAEERFQGIDWEDIFREIINLDITSVGSSRSQVELRSSLDKVYQYFYPLYESSKKYRQSYEVMLEERRERDRFLREQLQLNRDAERQEVENDRIMQEMFEYEWRILEANSLTRDYLKDYRW